MDSIRNTPPEARNYPQDNAITSKPAGEKPEDLEVQMSPDIVDMGKSLTSAVMDGIQGVPRFSRAEAAARGTNDIAVHLIGSDGPALLSIWANCGNLPHCLTRALSAMNVANVATGVISIALDTRETYTCITNPRASKMDKIMDVAHLAVGDIISTAASLVPLVAPLTGPLALGIFIGGQLLGIGADVLKTMYDAKRKGQQSVR